MTYSINRNVKKEDGKFIFEINEKVIQNESVGDRIGICEKDNILWVAHDCDLYDLEVINFVENMFTNAILTYNVIDIIKYK